MLTPEQIAALCAPFELDEHEIYSQKARDKSMWFVYVDELSIRERLDEVEPNWSWDIVGREYIGKVAIVHGRLTFGGNVRDGIGEQTAYGNDIGGNDVKGAATDAFRRAARMYGIGAYLKRAPRLMTDGNNRADEETSWKKFAVWYREQFTSGASALRDGSEIFGNVGARRIPQDSENPLDTFGVESMNGGAETRVFAVSRFETKLTKNNKPFLSLKADGATVNAFTTKDFADAGYDVSDWHNMGTHTLNPPAVFAAEKTASGWDFKGSVRKDGARQETA